MAINWPTQLPNPQISGYTLSPRGGLQSTKMDSGAVRVRQRFGATPVLFKLKFKMSQVQFNIFQSWWKFKLKGGSEFVNISLLVGRQRIAHEVRFIAQYKSNLVSNAIWEISASVEARELLTITEAELDALLLT